MTTDKILIWQTIFTGLTFLATLLVGVWAWRIGRKQNQVSDFVEVFVMPQRLSKKNEDGKEEVTGFNLLIKNASSYPVYINKYTLNGVNHLVGSSVVPKDSSNWYSIGVPKDVQDKGELSLEVEFEDYLGKKYTSQQYGEFRGHNWNIRGEKRKLIK